MLKVCASGVLRHLLKTTSACSRPLFVLADTDSDPKKGNLPGESYCVSRGKPKRTSIESRTGSTVPGQKRQSELRSDPRNAPARTPLLDHVASSNPRAARITPGRLGPSRAASIATACYGCPSSVQRRCWTNETEHDCGSAGH